MMRHCRTLATLLALLAANPSVASARVPAADQVAQATRARGRLIIVQSKGDFIIRPGGNGPQSAAPAVMRVTIGSSVHFDRVFPLPSPSSLEMQDMRHDPIH